MAKDKDILQRFGSNLAESMGAGRSASPTPQAAPSMGKHDGDEKQKRNPSQPLTTNEPLEPRIPKDCERDAERDAHDALARAADIQARLGVADTLECLADLAGDGGSAREAARLCGAAHAAYHARRTRRA